MLKIDMSRSISFTPIFFIILRMTRWNGVETNKFKKYVMCFINKVTLYKQKLIYIMSSDLLDVEYILLLSWYKNEKFK